VTLDEQQWIPTAPRQTSLSPGKEIISNKKWNLDASTTDQPGAELGEASEAHLPTKPKSIPIGLRLPYLPTYSVKCLSVERSGSVEPSFSLLHI
jgi:hypothetical protein